MKPEIKKCQCGQAAIRINGNEITILRTTRVLRYQFGRDVLYCYNEKCPDQCQNLYGGKFKTLHFVDTIEELEVGAAEKFIDVLRVYSGFIDGGQIKYKLIEQIQLNSENENKEKSELPESKPKDVEDFKNLTEFLNWKSGSGADDINGAVIDESS